YEEYLYPVKKQRHRTLHPPQTQPGLPAQINPDSDKAVRKGIQLPTRHAGRTWQFYSKLTAAGFCR
ncbi:hypothetical protein, partial [Paramuribaculum intestinale]|uniref:hypothetical protein n=1 Tax=Paramuribaculum intestinale TaxID=2094151 RepID=UPI0025B4BAE2